MSERFPEEETRHVDQVDAANHLADLHNATSLAAARALAAPEQEKVEVTHEDGTVTLEWEHIDCIDCGDPIEPARLAMGRVRCFSCQDLKEKRASRGLG